MKSVRLIPVVILAISALLVLKTLGLVTTGSYILGGVTTVQAKEGGATSSEGDVTATDSAITMPAEPTLVDASPTLTDTAPTLGQGGAEGGHGVATGENGQEASGESGNSEQSPTAGSEHKVSGGGALPELQVVCPPTDAPSVLPAAAAKESDEGENPEGADAPDAGDHGSSAKDGEFAASMAQADCVPLVDAVPLQVGPDGTPVPLVGEDGQSMSGKALLARLAERRTELDAFQNQLNLRASLVQAAEKKIEERQATLQALEAQISTLVDQRKEMETGQFTGIIALYENMRPKDAANIFNSLDMDVLLRVAKGMNPRKMSPILAEMDAKRAQELTVQMAALADQPPENMTQADLSALPQIVGQ